MCGHDIGFPNVRAASALDEQSELERRYNEAVSDSRARGVEDETALFEAAIRDDSHAVVTIDWDFFAVFVMKGAPYSTYAKQVDAEVRLSAEPSDDRGRHVVEAWLFPGYGKEIRYAALALDGRGLSSYGNGDVVVKLKNDAVAIRASVLEENSYQFESTTHPLFSVQFRQVIARLGRNDTNSPLRNLQRV